MAQRVSFRTEITDGNFDRRHKEYEGRPEYIWRPSQLFKLHQKYLKLEVASHA
jgi:hypothetical protein